MIARARARHHAQVAHVDGPVYGTIADETEEKTGVVVGRIVYEIIWEWDIIYMGVGQTHTRQAVSMRPGLQ